MGFRAAAANASPQSIGFFRRADGHLLKHGAGAIWGHPSKNTKDLATALFPRLLAERLDEIGLDFAIIYPTGGLRVPRVGADKPRRAAARAYNIVTAEYFRPFADRMTPAAIIPIHMPEE